MLHQSGADGHLRTLRMDQLDQRMRRHRPQLFGDFPYTDEQVGRLAPILACPWQWRFADPARQRSNLFSPVGAVEFVLSGQVSACLGEIRHQPVDKGNRLVLIGAVKTRIGLNLVPRIDTFPQPGQVTPAPRASQEMPLQRRHPVAVLHEIMFHR